MKTQVLTNTGLAQYDELIKEYIDNQSGSNTTYNLTKNEDNEIVLTGSDGSVTTVSDNDTTYTHPTHTAKANGLYKVTVDDKGHVSGTTAVTKADITALGIPASDTNTHYASKNVVGSSTATSNTTTALTNGNVYLNSVENGAVTSTHKISGSGATTVTSDANGNIVISSTDNDTKYTHPTTSGNKHIPSGGSSGQILRWSADGTAAWGADNNTTYSDFVKSGSGAKSGLVPAPSTTAGTTKYLREDGTWAVPPDTDTHYTSHLFVGASGGNANATTATSNPYLLCVDNTTNRNSIQLKAGSNMAISAVNGVVTFTATNTVYTHPTTAGNKHIPSGGAAGQVLKYSASGTAVWGNTEKIATSEPTDQAVGDFWLLAY